MTLLENLENLSHTFEPFIPLLQIGGSIALVGAGYLPRLGPGRAFTLVVRSLLFPLRPLESFHSPEIQRIERYLKDSSLQTRYMVVTGQKGIGKSCLIQYTLRRTPGVVKLKVDEGEKSRDIVTNVLRNYLNLRITQIIPYNAPLVNFWFRVFTLGRRPIVVLNIKERKKGGSTADVASAARELVEEYGLKVVIDSTLNSLDESALTTERQDIIEVGPMEKDLIWKIPQFKPLFDALDKEKLSDLAWRVLGGVPVKYEAMMSHMNQFGNSRDVLGKYLCGVIDDAIKITRDTKIAYPVLVKIIGLFDPKLGYIPTLLLEENQLQRPSPDKVFREVKLDKEKVLVPASNAVGLVLRHKIKKEPTLRQLENLGNRE